MRYIAFLHQCDSAMESLGGKGRSLARLIKANFPVPPGFVILPSAFEASLSAEHQARFRAADNEQEIAELLQQLKIPSEVMEEIQQTLAMLNVPVLAVRSSARDEDGRGQSFAGMLTSVLGVKPDEIEEAVKTVWRSGFSSAVWEYRRTHQLTPVPQAPAVVVQAMMNADVSGVGFGANPITGVIGMVLISSVFGLGTGLVSGEQDADTFEVDLANHIVARNLAKKPLAYTLRAAGGIGSVPVPDPHNTGPSLTDDQIMIVAQVVRACNELFNYPQDIEWVIAQGQLFVVQSRPITTELKGAPDEALIFWSDDDLESWNGLTTPITFSFLRHMYEANYRQISQMFRIPKPIIEQLGPVFKRILGLIRGRIFYNLSSTEDVWVQVPGFKRFRPWFSMLLGDTGQFNEMTVDPTIAVTRREKWADNWAITRALLGWIGDYRHWDAKVAYYLARVEQILVRVPAELEHVSLDRLIYLYHQLESLFWIEGWIPTQDNYFATFFYVLSGKAIERWCPQFDPVFRNVLLVDEGNIESSRAIRAFENLATYVSDDMVEPLCASEQSVLVNNATFRQVFEAYLARYGERCHEDLKLESPNIQDDPASVLRSVGALAQNWRRLGGRPQKPDIRAQAEAALRQALKGRPIQYGIVTWLLANARTTIRHRENMRFAQTRIMGRMRTLLRQVGRRMTALSLLDAPEDILYLEIDEIVSYVEGRYSGTNLKGLVALRQVEWEQYRIQAPPPPLFTTRGSVYESAWGEEALLQEILPVPQQSDAFSRRGIASSPGKVLGIVRLARDPKTTQLEPGDILMAEYWDPGLVMLFPSISGLLLERGSPLSHLAIVAREMGIPTVLAIPGLVQWLADGDSVELDGETGWVRKIETNLLAKPPGAASDVA